jgi:hypothetical protein
MNARDAMNAEDRESPTGPRGGTTTVTKSGMVKKNLWIPQDEAELLREKAFQERRSEADIIREGLRTVLEKSLAAAG